MGTILKDKRYYTVWTILKNRRYYTVWTILKKPEDTTLSEQF